MILPLFVLRIGFGSKSSDDIVYRIRLTSRSSGCVQGLSGQDMLAFKAKKFRSLDY